jgi:hypothetical protein
MKALLDFHHSDLLESLHLLLEDRLGIECYIPVGPEWWNAEVWQFGRWTWGDERLATQFLTRDNVEVESGHPERRHRCLTLAEAEAMTWDYVVASLPDNYAGYHRFAEQAGAKFVIQVGNTNQPIRWDLDPLVLNSSEMPLNGRGVTYHQEFSTKVYRYAPPRSRSIASFVNCMPSQPCYPFMQEAQLLLQDREWKMYGIDGPDGNLKPDKAIAKAMRAAGWAWHDKVTGDGFGHVIHNLAATGRPLIGHSRHYDGKLAEPFWRDGETCIDLDRHSITEAVDIIRSTDRLRHREMCEAMYHTFLATVDFEADAEKVRELLM